MSNEENWPLGKPYPEDIEDTTPPVSATPLPPDMSDEAVRERMAGAKVIDLRHANQEKVSESSHWKAECPFCTEGLFLVQRNQNPPHQLLEYDNCIGCGQIVRWVDIDEMRQRDGVGL